VGILEAAHLFEQHPNLIVAVHVTPPMCRPLGVRERFDAELRHGRSRRRREVGRCADQDHRLHSARLLGRHVQQRLGAGAQADGFRALDAEAIEEREHVLRALPERERARRVRRSPVAAKVGNDDAEALRVAGREHQLPVSADAGAAVQQEQWIPGSTILVMQLESVDVEVRHAAA
jgi:hypothetical protein